VARETYYPVEHRVYNELDSHGDLLGLHRLESERNPEYKARLFDVFVNRASSSYEGLINGITRELGLSMYEPMSVVVPSGAAIVFEETKCYLYSDYENGTLLDTLDRFDQDSSSYTISGLVDTINNTGSFTATLLDTTQANKRSMTIMNQSSVKLVTREEIGNTGARISLQNQNLIEGTVSVQSNSLRRRVANQSKLVESGDYLIDLENGIVFTVGIASGDTVISYQYKENTLTVKSSPVIIHDLQSDDFSTKMYEQVVNEDGDIADGLPTYLGADIINELMSVFSTNWGE
jgi:hypothetical protein